jgi:tetratricopeptide (TPR) repeat protein
LAIQERLAAEHLTVTDYQNNLARSYNNLGILHETTGNREAALLNYERALGLQQKLAADHPDVVDYQLELGGSCCNLGNLSGDAESAMVWFARAASALQGIVDRDHRHRNARLFLRNTYWGRAKVLGTQARYGEAADDWQRAAELDDGGMRTVLCCSRADALARAGDHAHAAAEAGQIAMIDRLPAEMLYNLACVVSLCAAAAKDDAGLAERYAARAVELLARAEAAGFFNDASGAEHLDNDTDLDALRERNDFRKFVGKLTDAPQKSQE